MSVSLGQNVLMMRSLRMMERTTARLEQNFQRLSSGSRINRGKDDAAVMAIAGQLNARGRMYAQTMRDVNDVISRVNVVDNSLTALGGIVSRISELSMQAANGPTSSKQRAILNTEATALVQEYNRIVKGSTYNDIAVLDGSNDSLTVYSGTDPDHQISVAIGTQLGATAGDGTFTNSASSGLFTGAVASGITGIGVGDLNDDGRPDMVVARRDSGVYAFVNNGDGTFSKSQTLSHATPTAYGPMQLVLGDVNNDGNLDMVGAPYSTGIDVALGNGDGTFQPIVRAVSAYSEQVGLADFNNDNNLDMIILEGSAGNRVKVSLGNGDGSFQAATTVGAARVTVGSADFNKDGNMDLFSGRNVYASSAGVQLGNGDGTFQASNLVTGQVAGDFNNDGNLDLVDVTSGGLASTRLGQGDGTFQAAINSVTVSGHISSSADINGDGNLDLVTLDSYGSNGVSILTGNGDGTFSAQTMLAGTAPGYQIGVADFNGDGPLDLIVPGYSTPLFVGNADSSGRLKNTIDALDLSTRHGAISAVAWSQTQQRRIAAEQGQVGAYQSRLESVIASAAQTKFDSVSAGSRIADADSAAESAEQLSNSLAQRLAMGVMAQANLQPEVCLNLIKDAKVGRI